MLRLVTFNGENVINDPIDDVIIAGAGISGIGMAVRLKQQCPNRSFSIIEQRGDIGGTWSLFNYPGVRSDSDMFTLGFDFEPWTEQKAIADGSSILDYLNQIVDKYNLRPNIHCGHRLVAAKWSSEQGLWTVTLTKESGETHYKQCRFLYMGTGYYDYEQGHAPVFEGQSEFEGDIVHPQFWPSDLDYQQKKIVVIGSGATAVTLLPALAKCCSHVTMLQRTPTWLAVRSSKDHIANFLRRIMPNMWAYKIIRKRNIWLQNWIYKRAKQKPENIAKYLLKGVRKALGREPDKVTFTPPYNPWDQRICLVPDGDMFKAMRTGKASIVTDHVERFTASGILLKSGKTLEADIIITATGLKLALAGKVAFTIDGAETNFADHFYYKGCMFANVPNMAIVFGYLNASWTLKVDIVTQYVCRLLNHMQIQGATIANPKLDDPDALEEEALLDFSSGYLTRASNIMPRQATSMPWRLTQDYLFERNLLLNDPVDDGILTFSSN